jgi:hypothetical protein
MSQQCGPCSAGWPPGPGVHGYPVLGRGAPPESRGEFRWSHHKARPAMKEEVTNSPLPLQEQW